MMKDTKKRYRLLVVARPEEPGYPEQMFKARAWGRTPLEARREVLERAWATGYLVSRIVKVEEVQA